MPWWPLSPQKSDWIIAEHTIIDRQNKQTKMKLLLIPILMALTIATNAELQQPTKMDMEQVEKLLQQIERDEAKLKPIGNEDPNVSQSLQELYGKFKQMAAAYVEVLNAVNRSIGLPKYPKLPGLSRQKRAPITERTPIKQIVENIRQVGTTLSEMGQLVSRVVTSISEDSRKTVLDQFRKFTDLWSNQLSEISRDIDETIRAVTGPNELMLRAEQEQETLFQQINRHLSQLGKDIQNYVDNLLTGVRNRLVGTSPRPALPRAFPPQRPFPSQ